MQRISLWLTTAVVAAAAVLGARALVAQDAGAQKDSLQVPDGLAFAEFGGYESWQVISVSQTDDMLKAILGNPAMIEAYKAGAPANGKVFPDGARMAKLMWTPKRLPDFPSRVAVPDTLAHIDFMVKDSKRFAATAGWGYAQFDYHPESDTFTPLGTGAACGAACHKIVAAKDSVFTGYAKR
jgi:hypothetical protein